MINAARAFNAGTFLLAVGLSLIFFQYLFAPSYGIELAILGMPIAPVAVAMAVAGAILTILVLRSK